MKKVLLIVFGLALCLQVLGQTDTLRWYNVKLSPKDTAYIFTQNEDIGKMISQYNITPPRYKIYKTSNMYNLIKLDTATGRVWQVQYRMKDVESGTLVIDDESLLLSFEDEIPGRYELYETNNNSTFIMVDTKRGYTYQVQWSTSGRDYRFRERIY